MGESKPNGLFYRVSEEMKQAFARQEHTRRKKAAYLIMKSVQGAHQLMGYASSRYYADRLADAIGGWVVSR